MVASVEYHGRATTTSWQRFGSSRILEIDSIEASTPLAGGPMAAPLRVQHSASVASGRPGALPVGFPAQLR